MTIIDPETGVAPELILAAAPAQMHSKYSSSVYPSRIEFTVAGVLHYQSFVVLPDRLQSRGVFATSSTFSAACWGCRMLQIVTLQKL